MGVRALVILGLGVWILAVAAGLALLDLGPIGQAVAWALGLAMFGLIAWGIYATAREGRRRGLWMGRPNSN